MIKVLLRLLINYLGSIINTDKFADKFAVSVKGVVRSEGKILFLKNEHNSWDFPGGKLTLNENINDTLIREIKEETNLEVKIKKLIYAENHLFNNQKILVVIFDTEIICENPIKISYEHTNYDFFDLQSIKTQVPEWVTKVSSKL